VVLYNCATGLKYPLPASDEKIDITKPIDYDMIAKA
jgi:threonine synthase